MNPNSDNAHTTLDAADHSAVLEARAKNAGKRTYTSAEVRARLGLAGKK